MKLEKRRIIAGTEILLMIISTFAFSYFVYSSRSFFNENYSNREEKLLSKILLGFYEKMKSPVFKMVSAQQAGCCSLSIDSKRCLTSYESDCSGQFAEGVLCSSTSFCVKGCCYDEEKGIYDKNVLRSDCKGSWNSDPNCNLPGAKKGCCVLGGSTSFLTEGQCRTESLWRGVELDWRNELNELQCVLLSSTQKGGACVIGLKECKFVTEASCLGYGGDFHEGYLCTAEGLNTTCERTIQTTCVEGKDGVYFVDSCGNIANIYDFSKMNDQSYWEKVIPLEQSCGATDSDGNSESNTCGNCNRFLGGICASASADNFKVNSGNFYCKSTSCMFKGETYKNGESWCVYDGKIGDGDDVVGSRHWRYVCNNGEIQVEPCADYRNQICIQSNSFDYEGEDIEFRTSSCVTNNWRECISLNSEEGGIEKCAETLNCEVKSVDIDRKFSFDVCTPKYPAGFDLDDPRYSETAESICGMASQTCTVVYEPKLTGGCEIKYNGDCLTEEFTQKMNEFCTSLGDCGGSVNIAGEYSENYKVTRAPKLSDSWVNKLKQLANPVPGQKAEVEDYTEYLKAAGVIKDGTDEENYDVTNDLMSVGTGVAGIGYAIGVYATGSLTLAGLSGVASMSSFWAAVNGVSALQTTVAPFAGVMIGIGIGFVAGSYLAKALGLAPLGSILMSIGGGVVGGVLGYEFIMETTLNPIFFWVGVALIVISFFFGGSDCEPKTVTFECKPWTPPTGGSDCEKCNGDPLKPCTEYRCESLGAGCELINKGTGNELCIHSNKDDLTPPKLQPQYGIISETEKYGEISEGGFTISKTDGSCLEAYTDILFGINTDEPAQCKYDFEKKSFSEMNFDFGSNLFEYNHTMNFNLPDPSHGESKGATWNGELAFYVICQDSNGNKNPNSYVIDMCVNQGPDKTPPRIRTIEPENSKLISFNSTEEEVKVITNELSTCKWDTSDKDYSLMANEMVCEDSLEAPSSTRGYVCRDVLPIASFENVFYIRCQDQPWLEEMDRGSERNANTQSMEYKLNKPESRIAIEGVVPNEDFRTSTEFTTIEILVTTSGGGNIHTCSYSMSGYEKMIEMFETGSRTHKQVINIPSGLSTIYVECEDETGDFARSETTFEAIFDGSSPQITRLWQEGEKVYFTTSEEAQCSYSNKNCAFLWNNKTETQIEETHSIKIIKGQTYYIRCKDEFGNLPSGCSISFTPI
ncbi:MAG: hypothetical protein WC494_02375 [Candidatus Pacearchaeota archaeon]